MDFHYNNREKEDGLLDFHRFVLLFSHSFSDRIRFISELELEHAIVSNETAGELELEQAYVDFLITRSFNVRAGMLLAPVGIINERHEPPVFHGVERPFVDTVIIPTTWFDTGVGMHGELRHGFRYRAYLMSPLDSTGFSADEGIREGRQKGAESNARTLAGTGRLEYVGRPGLVLGTSFWSGDTGFQDLRFDTSVTMVEFDGRYRHGEFEARGEYAHGFLDGMSELNASRQRTVGVSPNVARQVRGFYLESSYFVSPLPAPRELALFARYENFDTQYRMPTGFQPLKEFDREAWVFGLTYFPDPDIAVKLDYTVLRSQSDVVNAPDSFERGSRVVVLMTPVISRWIWVLVVAATAALVPSSNWAGAQERHVVEIVAERFSFTPSEIRVQVGTTLELRVRSNDTMHGFRIVGRNVNLTVPKRRQGEAVVLFEANEVGRFRFECSRMCGAGHSFMQGEIVVVEP